MEIQKQVVYLYNKQGESMSLEEMLKRNIRIKELTENYLKLKHEQFMGKQTEMVENTQGVNATNEQQGNVSRETKERKDSFPYALKQLKEYIAKIERNEWASKDEIETLKIIHRGMVDRFIGLDLF